MKKIILALIIVLFLQGVAFPTSLRNTNFYFEIAKGNISRHSFMLKFGENDDIDQSYETIWDAGATYVPPTQARLHNVISTDADDDGDTISDDTATGGSATTLVDSGATFQTQGTPVVAGDAVLNDTNVLIGVVLTVDSEIQLTVTGWISPNSGLVGDATESGDDYRVVHNASTGASIYHILGQDATRTEIDEFVVLNGMANVATVNTYVRQYRARIFGPGTTAAEGVITSTAQVDNTVSCQINDGANQTLMAVYSVPIDKIGYIVKWWGTISRDIPTASVSVMRLRGGTLDGIGYLLQSRSISTAASSSFTYDYAVPTPIPGGVDIWVEATSSANDTAVASGFDIILVDN